MQGAAINPIVEYTTTSTLTDSRPFTLGYKFTTSLNFTIDALGYWDDGLQNNHQVGLWDTSGNLLTSTTVLGTDTLSGHFRYHAINTYALAPGTYVLGGEFLGNNDPFPYLANGIVSLPGYTWVQDEQLYGSGLNYPTVTLNGGYGNNGIFMADMSVNGSTVPEPATVTLTLVSMALLAGAKWRRKLGARSAD